MVGAERLLHLYVALEDAVTFGFLLGSPGLLLARLVWPSRVPWRRVVLYAALWGWVTAFPAVVFNNLWLDQAELLIGPYTLADPRISTWSAIFQAATRGRVAEFAWALGLGYLVVCLPAYGLLRLLARKVQTRSRAAMISLFALLGSVAAAFVLAYEYAQYEADHFAELKLPQVEFAALAFASVTSWLCILSVVISAGLAVALMRRGQRRGLLFIACGLAMGWLAVGLF